MQANTELITSDLTIVTIGMRYILATRGQFGAVDFTLLSDPVVING